MKIKICGITRPEEIEYLNEYAPDFAGFVFYGPSKRNVTIEQAVSLANRLSEDIRRVAVMVSPEPGDIIKIQETGVFDIIQVHRKLSDKVLECAKLPVWYAVNIEGDMEEAVKNAIGEIPEACRDKISGIVADAKDFGSGKTFNWHKSKRMLKAGTRSPADKYSFILAGGLNPENVSEGIRIFAPDVVDVSSGVEGTDGKDKVKISAFIQAVRSYERMDQDE
ncbi:MAG: phosphoribosylanthranilate isomerase [Lachnospiraceae bacterium]|nr:phosphoribosylanthranilate isomerase [Lachnospiraceae bacterium]